MTWSDVMWLALLIWLAIGAGITAGLMWRFDEKTLPWITPHWVSGSLTERGKWLLMAEFALMMIVASPAILICSSVAKALGYDDTDDEVRA